MSESKHTPGPWTLTTVKTSVGICHKVGPFPWRDDKQNHACIYVDYPNHDGYMGPRETELLANARLIAAAPDLLAAAKLLMDFEHVQDRGSDSGGWQSGELEHAFDTLRATINKAEG